MVTSYSLYAWAAHFTLAIAATAFPEATPAVMGKHVAQPRITPAPSVHHATALRKRDSSVASFNTCGFINSNADSALYCGGDYSCVFFSSSAGTPGMAGCCATAAASSSSSSDTSSSSPSYATCNWYSTCYDSTRLSSIARTDAMALRCTESASPRCASWTWPALGVVDFVCTYSDDDYADDDSATATTTTTTTTTTPGGGNWTTIAVAAVDAFFSEPTSWSVDVTWVPASALAAARADVSSSTAAVVEGSAGGTGTVSGVVASSSAATGGSGGGGVQTGVIVGGVIGGVVGFVGLVAAAVMFCCLVRPRKQQNGETGREGRHEMQADVDPQYLAPAEVSGRSHGGGGGGGYFAHGTGTIAELDQGGWRSRPVEMDGMPKAVEMDTR